MESLAPSVCLIPAGVVMPFLVASCYLWYPSLPQAVPGKMSSKWPSKDIDERVRMMKCADEYWRETKELGQSFQVLVVCIILRTQVYGSKQALL